MTYDVPLGMRITQTWDGMQSIPRTRDYEVKFSDEELISALMDSMFIGVPAAEKKHGMSVRYLSRVIDGQCREETLTMAIEQGYKLPEPGHVSGMAS